MSEESSPSIWGDTSYLDAVTALEGVRAYKQRTYAALAVQPGAAILDVGCGNGDDVLALAQLAGPTGRAVGVDVREAMIAESRKRGAASGLPVQFALGSVYQLDFSDGTFDGVRADRLFQHLNRPDAALAEMIRVTRPGGRVVVFDVDWETLIVDVPDRAILRKLVQFEADRHANGWAGRGLLRLFRSGKLQDVIIAPETGIITDFAVADAGFGLRELADDARQAGVITADEAQRWIEQLELAVREDRFFSAIASFTAVGRRPL